MSSSSRRAPRASPSRTIPSTRSPSPTCSATCRTRAPRFPTSPYTLWHLSYVVIGGCLAPHPNGGRLTLTVLAFFLGLGVAAHALDELNGRPLQTRIPTGMLVTLAVVSLAGACAIGVAVAFAHDLWLLAFVAFGAFIAPAYNLELFGGRFHNWFWLATAWGAFPILPAYFPMADRIT